MKAAVVDLNDTSRCPVAKACEVCGNPDDLDVVMFEIPLGVFCDTLCATCLTIRRYRGAVTIGYAVALVGAHCEHLGINVDQMADALEAERSE